MKTTLKTISLAVLSTISLIGCNSGASSNTTPQSSVAVKADTDNSSKVFYSLGSGYIQKLNTIVNSGSSIEILEDDPITARNPTSSVEFSSSNSNSSIVKKLGINGSIKGKYQEASGEIIADFLDEEKINEQSFNYYLGYSSDVDVQLTKKYLVDFEPDGSVVREQYGDNYINSLKMGIGAFLKINISSTSKEALLSVKGALKGSYGDLAGLDAALDKLESNVKSSVTVKVSALQLGGDVEQLLPAIGTDSEVGEDGYGIYNCGLSTEGMKSCNQILTNFEKYAKDTNTGLNGQIKKYVTGLTKSSATYKDTKILFPMNNSFNTLNSRAKGFYYNTKNEEQKNVVNTIDKNYLAAITSAEKAYTVRVTALDELLKINALTGGVWNSENISNSKQSLITSSDELYKITTTQCLQPSVVDDKVAREDCIDSINNILSDEVIQNYTNLVKNKFKGFTLATTNQGSVYREFLVPQVDEPNSFVSVMSPTNLTLAKFSPTATWFIDNGQLSRSSFSYGLIPDLNNQQYTPENNEVKAELLNDGKTLKLSGTMTRKSGDASDSNKEIILNSSYNLTVVPTN